MTVTPEFQDAVNAALGADLLASAVEHDHLIVTIPGERIVPVLTRLRDDPGFLFEQLIVACEPVKLGQDFRTFDFTSPWEAITEIQLPGDEKATKPPYWEKPV